MKPTNKSINIKKYFTTMDIETRTINGVMNG